MFKSLELHHWCKMSSYATERLLHIPRKGLKIAGKSCPSSPFRGVYLCFFYITDEIWTCYSEFWWNGMTFFTFFCNVFVKTFKMLSPAGISLQRKKRKTNLLHQFISTNFGWSILNALIKKRKASLFKFFSLRHIQYIKNISHGPKDTRDWWVNYCLNGR